MTPLKLELLALSGAKPKLTYLTHKDASSCDTYNIDFKIGRKISRKLLPIVSRSHKTECNPRPATPATDFITFPIRLLLRCFPEGFQDRGKTFNGPHKIYHLRPLFLRLGRGQQALW